MTQDQSAYQRIDELLASGTALHSITQEPLTKKDIAQLMSARNDQMIGYLFMGILLVGVPFLAADEDLTWVSKIIIATGVFVGYGTLVVLVYLKMNRAYKQSSKEIIKGFITSKNAERKEKNTHYSLMIGKEEFNVSLGIYAYYQVGDAAEFHRFSKWGTVLLSHKKIDGAGLLSQ
jgi:hypothetical protein